MSTVLLAPKNRADECTLSGGSYAVALPLPNLQDRDINKVARTTDALAASTQFQAALTAQRPIRAVGVMNTNCSRDAQYRIRIFTDAGLTDLVHDSGTLDVFPAWMYEFGSLDWEDSRFWDGKPLAEDIEYFSSDVIYPLPSIAVGRYILVEFTDTGNSDGYLEFGRLFVGEGWQPTYGIALGDPSLGQEDLSSVDAQRSGKEFFAERGVRRSIRFQLQWLSTGEGARVQDMQRTAKTVNEVLFVFDPDDMPNMKRSAFMGRLRTLGALEWPFPEKNAVPFEIQEIL